MLRAWRLFPMVPLHMSQLRSTGPGPKLLEQLRSALRSRHYSQRTEKAYVSTQNQALSALLFPYRHVLDRQIGPLLDVIRARKPARLPVVMTCDETRAAFRHLSGEQLLMALLVYSAGLRPARVPPASHPGPGYPEQDHHGPGRQRLQGSSYNATCCRGPTAPEPSRAREAHSPEGPRGRVWTRAAA